MGHNRAVPACLACGQPGRSAPPAHLPLLPAASAAGCITIGRCSRRGRATWAPTAATTRRGGSCERCSSAACTTCSRRGAQSRNASVVPCRTPACLHMPQFDEIECNSHSKSIASGPCFRRCRTSSQRPPAGCGCGRALAKQHLRSGCPGVQQQLQLQLPSVPFPQSCTARSPAGAPWSGCPRDATCHCLSPTLPWSSTELVLGAQWMAEWASDHLASGAGTPA